MLFSFVFSIVHRDIKPENTGFDCLGNVKIFDFGLATRLDPKRKVGSNEFKATGFTGTQRYMAPEVARYLPYGTPVDVYSFAIMLWEMLSLESAFEKETCESHARKVYGYRNVRPKIKSSWPSSLQKLIRYSWSADPQLRPSFDRIHHFLSHF